MSENRFTSGPWLQGPHYKSEVESREGRICECTPLMSPRAEANACLIAAAPELYAALKLYVAHFGDPLKVANKALAKAEGRQIHASSEAAK